MNRVSLSRKSSELINGDANERMSETVTLDTEFHRGGKEEEGEGT